MFLALGNPKVEQSRPHSLVEVFSDFVIVNNLNEIMFGFMNEVNVLDMMTSTLHIGNL